VQNIVDVAEALLLFFQTKVLVGADCQQFQLFGLIGQQLKSRGLLSIACS